MAALCPQATVLAELPYSAYSLAVNANNDSLAVVAGAVLDGLDGPAIALDTDYRILAANHAYRRVFGNGADVTGQTCFSVSHAAAVPCDQAGEVCPMQLAEGAGAAQRVLHIHHTPRGDVHVSVEARPVYRPDGSLWFYLELLQEHPSGAAAAAAEHGLVGRSPAFMRVLDLVHRVASSMTTALLLGESGTGKELVARAIHDASDRRDRPFVPVECSGLTESLFESELFGHERGAFTGAHAAKPGLVEAAKGGTLFLDEVGDIPPLLQVKLLRLLETRTFRRVGSVEPQEANFRLVCATHRDLGQLVAAGEFRQDLYYRICAFPIPLPPLRERREDIPLLVETLLRRIPGAQHLSLSEEAMDCLRTYPFPGNIRELRNILERAAVLVDGGMIRPEHLPDACREMAAGARAVDVAADGSEGGIQTLEEAERAYLRRVVASFRGDRRSLAQALGVSERTLFRKLQGL
jgi:transcriptional regulator with PAS, ATPase and Fis domain